MTPELSIILPAKNEANGLQKLLPELQEKFPDAEIVVVNDGSTDNTEEVCLASGVNIVSHRQSKGNGGAVKAGARAATGRSGFCTPRRQACRKIPHSIELINRQPKSRI